MEDFQKRMLDEHAELKERLTKLNAALGKDGFREKVGDYQYKLMVEQAQSMEKYLKALEARMKDMDINDYIPFMTFGKAIEVLKQGKVARRTSWSGNKFLYYVPANSYPATTDIAKEIADTNGNVKYKGYIAIRCKDGEVGFYTPTQCDVFAEDWEVLVDE